MTNRYYASILVGMLFLASCSDDLPAADNQVRRDLQNGAWSSNEDNWWRVLRFEDNFLTGYTLRYYENLDSTEILNENTLSWSLLESDLIDIGGEVWELQIVGDSLHLIQGSSGPSYGRIDLDLYQVLIGGS